MCYSDSLFLYNYDMFARLHSNRCLPYPSVLKYIPGISNVSRVVWESYMFLDLAWHIVVLSFFNISGLSSWFYKIVYTAVYFVLGCTCGIFYKWTILNSMKFVLSYTPHWFVKLLICFVKSFRNIMCDTNTSLGEGYSKKSLKIPKR
jgi:hypothetical protein